MTVQKGFIGSFRETYLVSKFKAYGRFDFYNTYFENKVWIFKNF